MSGRKLSASELRRLASVALNPASFLDEIHVATARGGRRFGDCIADFQRERFALIWPSLIAVLKGEKPPHSFHWWEATKGASKDSDLCLCLLWLLFNSTRQLRIQIGARDSEQADEIRLIARQTLKIDAELNRFIASKIEVRADSIINTETGSIAQILTSDSQGSSTHGARPDVVLINELSHISDREFAETLLDNADKVATSICIIATNAGWLGTWQAEWKANAATSSRWLVHEYKQPAPWIDLARLEESKKRQPKRYARLWLGVWAPEGDGDCFLDEDLAAAMTLTGPLTGPERGWAYVLGGDLGTANNFTALCVIGKHVGCETSIPIPARQLSPQERILMAAAYMAGDYLPEIETRRYYPVEARGELKLAHLAIFKPPGAGGRVDLSAVEREILRLHSIFGLQAASIESWQAEQMVPNLRRAGVPAELTHPTPPFQRAAAECVLSAFAEHNISLYPDPQLERDLRSLRIVERAKGNVKLEAPKGRGSHADSCSALGLALVVARRVVSANANRIAGPLICYP